jgi:Flp pilus assembly protein TadD
MFARLLLGLLLIQPIGLAAQSEQNPLDLSPEIKEFLDKKVGRGLPPMECLQALVSAVFQENELNFQYAPVTRSAAETFAERGGNCLSFTLLFVSMARHLNLDARFRELEIAPIFTKSGDLISLSLHLNAAVIIGSLSYAIDVFPAVNRIEIGGRVVTDERGLAHFYSNKGVEALSKGDSATAESYLQKALRIDPTTVCVWINLGAIKTQSGDLRQAETYYRKALELDPKDPAAMSNLASVCASTGRAKEALRLQAKVKEFREKNPYHHYNLGLKSFAEGKYQEAIVYYRKALKLKSAEHNFYFALARAYGMLGNRVEAVNNLQLAEKYASDAANKQRYAEKLELLKGTRDRSNS